jgi:hypothetical protein
MKTVIQHVLKSLVFQIHVITEQPKAFTWSSHQCLVVTHALGINKCLETDTHSASSGMDPTAKKDPKKRHLGYFQFLCNITWASPQLSFHSCNYGTSIGWCLHDLWVTCIHKYHGCYTSCLTKMPLQLSKHTDCMMLTRLTCLFDAVLSAHILQPFRVKNIWPMHAICVFMIIWSQRSPAAHCLQHM